MEHGNQRIFAWTNVPKMLLLRDRMKAEPEFTEFVEKEIRPLADAYWHGEAKKSLNVEEMKRQFNAIADVAERYKREHGIERL